MKKLYSALLISLVAATTCSAILWINPNRFGGGGGGGPAGALVYADFETDYSGAPPGWSANYDNNFWYGTPALVGTHSLRWTNSNQIAYAPFSAQSEVWVYAVINSGTAVASTFNGEALSLYDGSNNSILLVGFWGTNFRIRCTGIDTFPAISQDYNAGNLHVWIHYKKGTGSNGVLEVYHSGTSTKPGSATYSSTTVGYTADIAELQLWGSGAGQISLDDVLVSASAIGSNPWNR